MKIVSELGFQSFSGYVPVFISLKNSYFKTISSHNIDDDENVFLSFSDKS